jgi:UDP-N-acetylmuramate--alanine ligase
MIPSSRIRKLHFIGIGGSGMSGIAEILHHNGFQVTGSDQAESQVVQYLSDLGLKIQKGHEPDLVLNSDLVVYSSAVKPENPEMIAAKAAGIPCIRRAEMLGELMRLKYTLAIAGTHGKTTTTSMVGHIWTAAQLEPTIIVGGIVKNLGTGAQHGAGEALIAEADEYDKSFLDMVPTLAVLTNIEEDHLDCYKDLEDIKSAFISFANKVPFYGIVVACIDDEGVRDVLPFIRKPVVTYGFSAQAEYRADGFVVRDGKTFFRVRQRGVVLGEVEIQLTGRHNAQNALAAVSLALEEGISFEIVQKALANFTGVKRRFEWIAAQKGILFYDDYAHHPTEVEATLKGIRESFDDRRLIVIFQPHLFSRTRDHYKSFASALLNSDIAIVADVYGARETAMEGVDSGLIIDAAKQRGHTQAHWIPKVEEIVTWVKANAREGDLILSMGAGPIWKIHQQWQEWLSETK